MCYGYSTLRDYILEKSKTYSDKTVFQFWGKNRELINISYSDLLRDVYALGTYLLNKGYSKQHIAIISENSYDWIRLFFAISFSGNICVPIAKDLGESIISDSLRNADCVCVFYSKKCAILVNAIVENNDDLSVSAYSMTELDSYKNEGQKLIDSGDKSFTDMDVKPEDVAAIYFTSGTTGSQKCVQLTQGNLAFNLQSTGKSLSCAIQREKVMVILPLTHALSFSIMCHVFHHGRTGFICSGLKAFFIDITEIKPDILGIVPLFLETVYKEVYNELESKGKMKQYKMLCAVSRFLLKLGIDIRPMAFKEIRQKFGGNLKLIISGSAPLSQAIIDEFDTWGIDVITGYGITECSPIISVSEFSQSRPESVGKPLDGVEVIIDDPNEKGIGEICVKGPTVMKGYYNNSEETAKALEGGMFHTGDLGYLSEEGYLYITGRIKNLIILSNGENVSPELIENKIIEHTIVKEVLVYQKDNLIVAEIYPNMNYIEKNNIENVKDQILDVVNLVNKGLPTYSRIGDIVVRNEEFTKNSSKKIVRK